MSPRKRKGKDREEGKRKRRRVDSEEDCLEDGRGDAGSSASGLDTYGWETAIPEDWTISKAMAMLDYRLTHADFQSITAREKKRTEEGRHAYYIYNERAVEWKAWEKHGGPIGLWKFLKALKKEHEASGSTDPFDIPYSYAADRLYDLDLPETPELSDRYVGDLRLLRYAKQSLPPWLWNVCNSKLNKALLDGKRPNGCDDLTEERQRAIGALVSFVNENPIRYIEKPAQDVAPSLYIATLRSVLAAAPIAPRFGSQAWGTPVAGLDFCEADGHPRYEWCASYLQRIFKALCTVISKHGIGNEGWRSIRWEVYETVFLTSPSVYHASCLTTVLTVRGNCPWRPHILPGTNGVDGLCRCMAGRPALPEGHQREPSW
ncbi:hypothetical protein BD309DRAFT_876654 [Dichomitus squalens]|nr:hypothetical protein BD309DRAFT_876654 [Dichomitus squalens]